jgi:extracellular elastinolytic metalloproteinase
MRHLYFSLLSLFLVGTTLQAQQEVRLIQAHLQENRSTLGLTGADVLDWRVADRPGSKAKGVTIVHTIQSLDGLDVHNAIGTFVIRDGRVVHFTDRFLRDVRSRVMAGGSGMQAQDALRHAAVALGLPTTFDVEVMKAERDGRMELKADAIARGVVKARPILQPMEDGRILRAWDLSIRTHKSTEWWLVAIDASTGSVLRANNIVVECLFPDTHQHVGQDALEFHEDLEASSGGGSVGYRVFPMPIESPSHGTRSLEVDPHDPTASPFGWHDVDGVVGAEHTITQGNNVLAADDIDNDDVPGYSPDGGSALNFDFALDLSNDPIDNIDASVTNLFFWNNVSMMSGTSMGSMNRAGISRRTITIVEGWASIRSSLRPRTVGVPTMPTSPHLPMGRLVACRCSIGRALPSAITSPSMHPEGWQGATSVRKRDSVLDHRPYP